MITSKAVRTVLVTLAAIAVLMLVLVGPVERTPASSEDYSDRMRRALDGIVIDTLSAPQASFSVGFAVVNMTPTWTTSTAGYGKRRGKPMEGIRDSVYVRAMVIDNGKKTIAIVSADLLIIPPIVTSQLDTALASIGFNLNNTYLGATHTHNSIGNWAEGAVQFLYGDYDPRVVALIVRKIVESVRLASTNLVQSRMRAGMIAVPSAVRNRLIRGGEVDNWLRVMEVIRADSSRLALLSYTAHATCLPSSDLQLSRDYPGRLVDTLESRGYTFAMFLAGAVASHGPAAPTGGDECIDWMASELSNKYIRKRDQLKFTDDATLEMVRVPLPLSDPQLKIAKDIRVRSWFFRQAVGEYPAYITGLRVGNVMFMGTPSDFSGAFNPQIDSIAVAEGFIPVVTSFNGGYIGYLTPEQYYDYDHYETRLMNWYAPGTGEYVAECLTTLMEKFGR